MSRQLGKPVTAKRYHLYRDCSRLSATWARTEIVEIQTDREMELLGNPELCDGCLRTREERTAEECLVEVLREAGIVTPIEWSRIILARLHENEFVVVKVGKRIGADPDDAPETLSETVR